MVGTIILYADVVMSIYSVHYMGVNMLHNAERKRKEITGHEMHISYSSSPKTTATNATMMPAPRLIWTMLAPPEYGVLVDEDPDPVDDEVVPFCCFAAAWKAAKLLGPDSTEFTLKTIPEPQWLACLQYAQMGVVALTVMLNVGKVVAPSATGMNPESNPT